MTFERVSMMHLISIRMTQTSLCLQLLLISRRGQNCLLNRPKTSKFVRMVVLFLFFLLCDCNVQESCTRRRGRMSNKQTVYLRIKNTLSRAYRFYFENSENIHIFVRKTIISSRYRKHMKNDQQH